MTPDEPRTAWKEASYARRGQPKRRADACGWTGLEPGRGAEGAPESPRVAIPGAEQVDERFLRPQIALERRSEPINDPPKRRKPSQTNHAETIARTLGWIIVTALKLVKWTVFIACVVTYYFFKMVLQLGGHGRNEFTGRRD